MTQSIKFVLASALVLATSQAGAAAAALPTPTFDCITMYFGPLQPLVTAICRLGS